jgi:hypothetical protein
VNKNYLILGLLMILSIGFVSAIPVWNNLQNVPNLYQSSGYKYDAMSYDSGIIRVLSTSQYGTDWGVANNRFGWWQNNRAMNSPFRNNRMWAMDWVAGGSYGTTYVGGANGQLYLTTDGYSWTDLSATDVGDWVGTSTVNSINFDGGHRVYTGMSDGKFGLFNTIGGWEDYSATDSGDWVGTSTVNVVKFDAGHYVFTGMSDGKFGFYNTNSMVWTDLSATDDGDWIGTSAIFSLAVTSETGKVYVGMSDGKFGFYNNFNGLWSDLSATDVGDWVGTSTVKALTFDSVNNLIYTGMSDGKFGYYNISDNVWYDLTSAIGVSSINSLEYNPSNFYVYVGGNSVFGFYNPIVCTENWIQDQPSSCDGLISSYTITYTDSNTCGTSNNLPVDSGTVIPCCVENWTQQSPSTCDGLISEFTINYLDSNTCGTVYQLPMSNGSIIPCCVGSGCEVKINFTTSGSWTVPYDAKRITVELIGAGGSSAGWSWWY